MKRIATIGAVVAALVVSASATAGNARHHARSCCREPIFQKGQNVSIHGPHVFRNAITVWVNSNGSLIAVPYGKLRTEDGR
jgi:hypothetical protein